MPLNKNNYQRELNIIYNITHKNHITLLLQKKKKSINV